MALVTTEFKMKISQSYLSKSENGMLMASKIFSGLSSPLQQELLQIGDYKTYKRGEFLFMDNDPIDHVYYLFSGKIREYYCTGDGADCLRNLHSPGSYVSLHMAMSPEEVYPYSCEVIRNTTVFAWRAAEFKQLVSQQPELSQRIMQLLSSYVEASCRKICLCRKSQAVSRVAGYLLSIDKDNQEGCPCYLRLTGSKPTANIRPVNFSASDVCLARETFSRAVSLLQDQNLIKIDQGHVDILDVEGLKRVSEGA